MTFHKYQLKPLTLSILLAMSLLTGCTKSVSEASHTTTTVTNEQSTETDKPLEVIDVKNPEPLTAVNTSDNQNKVNDDQHQILEKMLSRAKQGKVINSEYAANESVNISDIENALGQPNPKEEWVSEAKGAYSTFADHQLVFGSNKGGAIFEVRSFDKSLSKVTRSSLLSAFGQPHHIVETKREEIMGFVINDQYKLLAVFPKMRKDNLDPSLDHYSILYPKGTVNIMADDPGRQW